MKRSISSLLVMFLIVINFTGCAAATEQGGTLDTTATDSAAQATDTNEATGATGTTGATGATGATSEPQGIIIEMRIGDPVMTVNGAETEIDPGYGTAPTIGGERTLVPIRAVIEALGGSVEWNEAEREVVLTMNSDVISLTIDSDAAYLNGEEHILDTAPVVINGRTMLPIRFIAEGFGLSVDWNEAEQSVTIADSAADETVGGVQNTVSGETEQEEDDGMISINVRIGGEEYSAKLYDNETAREWVKQFPAEYEMSELNGNEKYYYLQDALPTDSVNPGGINAGDIMLYGSSCIVLFYDTFQTSYSYTRLGYIEDPDGLAAALGSGDVTIGFELD